MNKRNVASFKASKKLVDNGIKLDTDCFYKIGDGGGLFDYDHYDAEYMDYPAPSMAEVWRELPEHITKGGTIQYLEMGKTGSKTYAAYDFADDYILFDNPTDALIDLLIWVKEQNKDRIVNKLLDRADKLKW